MSNTPESDACMEFFGFTDDDGGADYVNYEFACKLERERDEAREQNAKLRDIVQRLLDLMALDRCFWGDKVLIIEGELDQLKEGEK